MESSIAVFLGWKPWFAGHCKHATALVNHTLVQKKDADHALQHRPQATYVGWKPAIAHSWPSQRKATKMLPMVAGSPLTWWLDARFHKFRWMVRWPRPFGKGSFPSHFEAAM